MAPFLPHRRLPASRSAADRAGGQATAALALLLAVGLGASPAWAQAPRDPAAAEELFRAGLTALDRGDWDEACSKFEASMRLDPSAGTSINVARCLERSGRLAGAWAELERARVLAREEPEQRRREVEEFVEGEIRRIEPRIPRLRIGSTRLPAGVAIRRDGIPLAEGALGVPLPVDPGRHVVEATAPGHRPGRWTVRIDEGTVTDVAVQLEPIPGGAFAAPDDVFEPAPGAPARARAEPTVVVGVVLTGVGGAALVVGAVAGIGALDAKADIDGLGCEHETLRCPSERSRDLAQSIADRGGTMAAASTIAFLGGGLLAAAGITTLVVDGATDDAPRQGVGPRRPAGGLHAMGLVPVAAPDGAGLGVRGSLW